MTFSQKKTKKKLGLIAGADLGGGGRGRTPSLRYSTPCRHKRSPLVLFKKSIFGQKKGRQNFRNFFFENPPPLEKILDLPLLNGTSQNFQLAILYVKIKIYMRADLTTVRVWLIFFLVNVFHSAPIDFGIFSSLDFFSSIEIA